jgi:excisionase family DNA binding protein
MKETRYLSRHDAAFALSISVSSIDRAIAANQVPAVHLGRRVLVPVEALAELKTNGNVHKNDVITWRKIDG